MVARMTHKGRMPDDVVIRLECCWRIVGTIDGRAARPEWTEHNPTVIAIFGNRSRPAKSSRVSVWVDKDVPLEWEEDGRRFVVTCPTCERKRSMTRNYARTLAAQVRQTGPGLRYAGIQVCIPWDAITAPRDTPSA